MLEEVISINEINQKLAESELPPSQIDQIRHQDELDSAKKAELAKGFDPQLKLLIENVLKATNLSHETKLSFTKAMESGNPNPSILKGQPFPEPDQDKNMPLGDLERILSAVGKDAEILVNQRVYQNGIIEPIPDGQESKDYKNIVIRTPNLPNVLLRVGVVNGLYQGREIFGKKTKQLSQDELGIQLSTKYSPSQTPNAEIFLFEAIPAKVPMKTPLK